jgi:histone H1/5
MAGSDIVPAVVEGEDGGDEAVLVVSGVEKVVAVENSSKGGESKAVTVKEKKVKIPKEKKPKSVKGAHASSTAAHPSYLLMVKEAIGALKERTGSSQYAIAKYLEDMYKTGLPPNFKKILSIQLRNMTKQGKVYKVKNSFKLSDELKKPVKAPKAAMAIKDSSKEIKAHKPTKVAKKASSRVKSKTANGALSQAVKFGGVAVVAKPTKVPKSPKAPKSVKPVAVKPPRKAPVAASKSKDEEKVTAPSAVRKPAASLTNKPTAVKKTASKKKVGTPRKAPKSVKSAKSKSSKSAVIPGKISKTIASPAKRAKK